MRSKIRQNIHLFPESSSGPRSFPLEVPPVKAERGRVSHSGQDFIPQAHSHQRLSVWGLRESSFWASHNQAAWWHGEKGPEQGGAK